MSKRAILALSLAGACLVGCQPPAAMTMPAAFVQVPQSEQGPYIVRAISADGVVLALREETNPANGTLAFWAQAIETKLTQDRGYTLLKAEDFQSQSGRRGRLLHLQHTESGVAYEYMLGVYVEGAVVRVAEAAGRQEPFQRQQAAVRDALTSL